MPEEHFKEAENYLRAAREQALDSEECGRLLAFAQVHATLATVPRSALVRQASFGGHGQWEGR